MAQARPGVQQVQVLPFARVLDAGGAKEEGFAEVEYALQTQSELADGLLVQDLSPQPEASDRFPVSVTEPPVIHEDQAGRLQQGMPRLGDAWRLRQQDPFGATIVSVLHEFPDDGEAFLVA